jgi:hypothetical protein
MTKDDRFLPVSSIFTFKESQIVPEFTFEFQKVKAHFPHKKIQIG